ncbi:MAG: site-2 protease family protein, partial [Pseudomonadota bacterium]
VLFSRYDKRGTKWQVAALPFGGYVKFAGDANAASGKDEDAMQAAAADPDALRRTMHGAPLWARAATVAAGPVFNFVLSIIVFAAMGYSAGVLRGPLTIEELRPLPGVVYELRSGDIIRQIEGTPVPDFDDPSYSDFINELPVEPTLSYTVERDGSLLTLEAPYLRPPL